jgi:polysaccharide biosynthesis protein PslH
MKILFITPKIPYPPIDGHKKSMWGVIKYLSLLGNEIHIVAYRQNENPDSNISEIEKYAKLFVLNVQTGNSIPGALKNIFSPIPYNLSKYNRKELRDFLSGYFQKNNVDIIHVVNSHMGFVVDYIRQYSSAPVVLRQENLEMMIMKRYCQAQNNFLLKIYSFIQYKKFIKYEPALCAKFDRCIMMSREDDNELRKLNPNVNTAVIPLGIEKDLLKMSSGQIEKYSLVHIGSLNWYPNFEGFDWFVQEIFPLVLEKYPDAKLYLYGSNLPKNYSLPQNVRDNIIIKGFVENIWEELKDKSLAVIPLRIGSGIRVKILEMFAAGKNIITTSLGKEGIELEDGREILVADSPEKFAEKIINFFCDKYDSVKMAEAGRNFIEKNYLWENIAARFQDIYQNLLPSNKLQ